MPLIIKRRAGYIPHRGCTPITRPHYVPGTPVRITAKGWPFFIIWRKGDTGIVEKMMPAGGMHSVVPDDDLYAVRLDKPRVLAHSVVYLRWKELESA